MLCCIKSADNAWISRHNAVRDNAGTVQAETDTHALQQTNAGTQNAQCSHTGAVDNTEQPQVVKSNASPTQATNWSSDHESDSDDSLQPYDLDEEDDHGELSI